MRDGFVLDRLVCCLGCCFVCGVGCSFSWVGSMLCHTWMVCNVFVEFDSVTKFYFFEVLGVVMIRR